MPRYELAGIVLESSESIPGLRRTRSSAPGLMLGASLGALLSGPWRERRPGRPRIHQARTPSGFGLRFDGVLDCEISARGDFLRWRKHETATDSWAIHLVSSAALPVALSLHRDLVLHASAVSSGRKAFVLLGSSGSGKSTLAAALSRRGFRLMADDCLALHRPEGGWVAFRGEPRVRLRPASLAALGQSVYGRSPLSLPLGGLYVLELASPRSKPACRLLRGRGAFVAVARRTQEADPWDPKRLAIHFDAIADLLATVPLWSLRIPGRFDALPEVCDLVGAQAAGTG